MRFSAFDRASCIDCMQELLEFEVAGNVASSQICNGMNIKARNNFAHALLRSPVCLAASLGLCSRCVCKRGESLWPNAANDL